MVGRLLVAAMTTVNGSGIADVEGKSQKAMRPIITSPYEATLKIVIEAPNGFR